GRAVSLLTAPPVALACYTAVIVGSHLTGLMDTIMRNTIAGQVEHLVYLIAGYQFFVLIVGDEPIRWRLSTPARWGLLAVSMAVDTFTGVTLMMATTPIAMRPPVGVQVEPLRVEGGAMIAHSAGVQLESKAQGGIMKGLKRSVLGGGSFFVTTYTAPATGGWVDVAGVLPGDTVPITIAPERPFFITRGSWIANSHGVEIDTQWGGMANMFGGEGGFGFRATGQ